MGTVHCSRGGALTPSIVYGIMPSRLKFVIIKHLGTNLLIFFINLEKQSDHLMINKLKYEK